MIGICCTLFKVILFTRVIQFENDSLFLRKTQPTVNKVYLSSM